MADGYQAVALGIKPADPGQAFDSINNILGIQQKRQGLQIQALKLQQEQLATQQQQGVQDFFQSFDPTDHIGSDGTTDVNSVHTSDAYKKAGNAKPLIDQTLGQIKQQQLTAKQGLQTLDDDTLGKYSQTMNTLQNDEDVKADNAAGRKKVDDLHQQFASLSPQAARVAGTFAPITQHAKQGDLSKAVGAVGLMGADVIGQRGQQNPQQTTNAAGQILNRSVGTGALSAPPDAAPGTTLNPSAPMVAGATALATGAAGGDVDRANEVGSLQQQSSAAIQLTKQADKLKEELDSGHLAKMISNTGNYLGFSSVNDARAQLNQDLGKMKGLVAARAGSDSRAAAMLEGYPQDTTPNNTFHADMDYLRGTARQNLARGKLLDEQYSKDRRGFQAADNLMSRSTSPLMHEFNALKPEERGAFYKHNFTNPQDAQAFKHEVEALKKHSHVLD